ncbi:MAG: hypothetical protein RLY20_95 [Verrucomicrobiota bacterium]
MAPGDVLFNAGDAPDGMFVLLEGALEIRVGEVVVESSTRGAIIGEMAIIDASPRAATVVASQSSSLAKIDALRFQRLIQQNPFFATHVMKVLVDRIRQINRLVSAKGSN